MAADAEEILPIFATAREAARPALPPLRGLHVVPVRADYQITWFTDPVDHWARCRECNVNVRHGYALELAVFRMLVVTAPICTANGCIAVAQLMNRFTGHLRSFSQKLPGIHEPCLMVCCHRQ